MSSSTADCTVYFDGACPLCRREIEHYRGLEGSASIVWVDAATCDPAAFGDGLSRTDALSRLHVRQADGSLASGAAAFASIWARLPAYRWLAGVASRAWTLKILDAGYSAFLRLRPLWRRSERSPMAMSRSGVNGLRRVYAIESAALQLYRGTLATARDGDLRAFAASRLALGHLHLQRLSRSIPGPARNRLLPLWRAAGWLTGATAALFSGRALRAIAVRLERAIDRRYERQIERLDATPHFADLRATLSACRRGRDDRDALAQAPARFGALRLVQGQRLQAAGMQSMRREDHTNPVRRPALLEAR